MIQPKLWLQELEEALQNWSDRSEDGSQMAIQRIRSWKLLNTNHQLDYHLPTTGTEILPIELGSIKTSNARQHNRNNALMADQALGASEDPASHDNRRLADDEHWNGSMSQNEIW